MQTYTSHISINYLNNPTSLLVIHDGVDLTWLSELGEYFQYILDQLPEDFKKAYHPLSYTITTDGSEATHIVIFHRYAKTGYELTDAFKWELTEIFYDQDFSWDQRPTTFVNEDSLIIVNRGFN